MFNHLIQIDASINPLFDQLSQELNYVLVTNLALIRLL